MTSTRPYLLRAVYQWILDNELTPYLLVDGAGAGVEVPPQAVKDGRVVLNLAPRAVSQLDLGNAELSLLTRFSGVSCKVRVPMQSVLGIYAQENGQGMMFSAEDGTPPPDAVPPEPAPDKPKPGAHLRVIK
ncbi:MAG TPA: ClpXP protease specificity-enhancing factor [Rhodanobacteraceae bacterium]|nr:ClpXP protease specificity-enhancing factor [Rhodanobacteraceae bacterium]